MATVATTDMPTTLIPTAPASATSQASASNGSQSAPNPAATSDGETASDEGYFDDMSFWDVLDVVNPLHHIPIVGTIYRELSGDEIKSGPRLAGGFLFGGPIGLAAAGTVVVVDKTTGMTPGEHLIAMVSGDDTESDADLLVAENGRPTQLIPNNFEQWASIYGNGGNTDEALQIAAYTNSGAAPSVTGAASVAAASTARGPQALNAAAGSVAGVRPSGPSGAQLAAATSAFGTAPASPPIGYHALGGQATASAKPNTAPNLAGSASVLGQEGMPDPTPPALLAAQLASASAPGSTGAAASVGERGFTGRDLADYRNRAIRVATRPPAGTPQPASAPSAPGTGSVASGQPDPAIMAQLLAAERSGGHSFGTAQPNGSPVPNGNTSGSSATRVGDTLTIPSGPTTATPANPVPQAPTSSAQAGSQPTQSPDSLGPWFNNKVMDALEKYQRMQGVGPLSSSEQPLGSAV